MGSIGGNHSDLPLDFSDSLLAWGTSLAWRDDQQGEFRGNSCRQGFISTGVRLYLQVPTLGVHEMDVSVEHLHVETDMTLYDHDALFLMVCRGLRVLIPSWTVSEATSASR